MVGNWITDSATLPDMTGLRPPLAALLDLAPHPEGGWYRETWRSPLELTGLPGYAGPRSAGTAIHYLLGPGESSAWHQVRSAELWFWHRGGPLVLTLGGDGDVPTDPVEHLLGADVETGQLPALLVPPGVWQSARPAGDAEVLVSCVVVPGFDFADFRLTESIRSR
ncbi:cupin domain-containing protein [Sporichthya brevicatena]|uniref:Cupin domain-containing protein n=2 Tax=Sporichthya brevicatena TaxID=171442 RepID=A0ABP3S7Y7_9ACTN